MNIGKTIRRLREARNMSQKQLAQQLSMTETIVSHWECGHRYPTSPTLMAIAQVFGMTVPLLLLQSVEKTDMPEGKEILYESLYKPLVKALTK